MNIREIINEANVAKKITDPRTKKMINLALHHDATLPRHLIARLGKRPTDDAAMNFFSDLLDQTLSITDYGDISTEGKYDQWLVRQYMNGSIDYEDIAGEGSDALGAFRALSIRGLLKPQHQDINQFRSLRNLITTLKSDQEYTNALKRIKDQEKLEMMKREKQEVVLIDDDRFLVSIPLNYGACYYFNNAQGVPASFCTGSSNRSWFANYASDGPMIDVLDKKSMGDVTGKYQIHAPTRQIKSADQNYRTSTDDTFALLYPGLLRKIAQAMLMKKDEIEKASSTMKNEYGQNIVPGGYNVPKEVELLKNTFPKSYASGTETK